MELDELRDPQRLAVAAKELGMVAPSQPAFIRLADGRVLGNPTPATVGDSVRVNPLPSRKPASLKRKTIIVKVPTATTPTAKPRQAPTPPAPPPLASAKAVGRRPTPRPTPERLVDTSPV